MVNARDTPQCSNRAVRRNVGPWQVVGVQISAAERTTCGKDSGLHPYNAFSDRMGMYSLCRSTTTQYDALGKEEEG
jgi:hypothetical protein